MQGTGARPWHQTIIHPTSHIKASCVSPSSSSSSPLLWLFCLWFSYWGCCASCEPWHRYRRPIGGSVYLAEAVMYNHCPPSLIPLQRPTWYFRHTPKQFNSSQTVWRSNASINSHRLNESPALFWLTEVGWIRYIMRAIKLHSWPPFSALHSLWKALLSAIWEQKCHYLMRMSYKVLT